MERKVSKPGRISDLVPGHRMAVLGTVVEKDTAGFFVLDDGKGKATVLVPADDLLEKLNIGSLVRVIGIVIEKSEIKAEIVQDMEGIDINIYNKYLDLHNKFK